MYASAKTLVWPCPEKKSLISDLKTVSAHLFISGWALPKIIEYNFQTAFVLAEQLIRTLIFEAKAYGVWHCVSIKDREPHKLTDSCQEDLW